MINKNGFIKSKHNTNMIYSNFGKNYSKLFLSENDAKIISYPDRNEQNLVNPN